MCVHVFHLSSLCLLLSSTSFFLFCFSSTVTSSSDLHALTFTCHSFSNISKFSKDLMIC